MKKNSLFILSAMAILAGMGGLGTLVRPLQAMALEDYTDADGTTHYGWNLVANETNAAVWSFGEDGMVNYCDAANGDTAEQRVYNYAIRNLAIKSAESDYSVSCTFTPNEDSDLSAERTYGIVPWYQDADNYLIYWLQQKTGGNWSGQFYGRIGGAFRAMYIPESEASGAIEYANYWRKGEYYDMWWDQASDTNPELYNKSGILLTQTVTLKVESVIEKVTVNSEEATCRKFSLHQIVNGNDALVQTFYIKQINAENGDFYTGIYSEAFSVGISDFQITVTDTDFAAPVVEAINALPAQVSSSEDIAAIVNARTLYNDLLSYQSLIGEEELAKLDAAETAVGAYVDSVIEGLDGTKSSFKEDVESAYQLYSGLPAYLQQKVTKLDQLVAAINEVKTWTDPNSATSSEQPAASSSGTSTSEPAVTSSDKGGTTKKKSGCGGSIVGGIGIAAVALLGAGALMTFHKRKKE